MSQICNIRKPKTTLRRVLLGVLSRIRVLPMLQKVINTQNCAPVSYSNSIYAEAQFKFLH